MRPTPDAHIVSAVGDSVSSGLHRRRFAVNPGAYPFTDHWLERSGAAMHYVDEGAGLPVLMLHGNPTWSYLYRNVIKDLRGACRTIAPDYPGFGFSDHPPGYRYTPQEHAEWVRALIDDLQLDRFVLVAQDWGGPIGLSIAVEQPERVAGLVIANTWCWRPTLRFRLFAAALGGPIGKYFILRHNLFAARLLPLALAGAHRATPELLRAYTDPFPTPASRMGTYVFPWAVRHSDAWLEAIEVRLPRLRGRPVELVLGTRDPVHGTEDAIRRWHQHVPDAPVDRVPTASHYLQEEAPERISAALRRVLGRLAV